MVLIFSTPYCRRCRRIEKMSFRIFTVSTGEAPRSCGEADVSAGITDVGVALGDVDLVALQPLRDPGGRMFSSLSLRSFSTSSWAGHRPGFCFSLRYRRRIDHPEMAAKLSRGTATVEGPRVHVPARRSQHARHHRHEEPAEEPRHRLARARTYRPPAPSDQSSRQGSRKLPIDHASRTARRISWITAKR